LGFNRPIDSISNQYMIKLKSFIINNLILKFMPEKKFNWGTLVIGIVIGALAMWAIGAATKPAGGQFVRDNIPPEIAVCISQVMAGTPDCSSSDLGTLCKGEIARACFGPTLDR